jgi:diguanylate cyclase (GGDEF)-like protein
MLRELILTKDPAQALRISRHLMGLLSLLAFSLACIYFDHRHMFDQNALPLTTILTVFWPVLFGFTFILRSGLNKKLEDPSMTMEQMTWASLFLLTVLYSLNELRGVILMSYFALLSFGYFRLSFRDFLSVALLMVLGYLLIIIYMFVYEYERMRTDEELIQLLAFTTTTFVMVYTGSAVSRLRVENRKHNIALAAALEMNTRLAVTDDLTGLYTRRYLMDKLAHQKAISERDESDFVVCFADLDHFKLINDTYGHHTGDIVLKSFSGILRSSIREIDYVSRFGGEEFVVLLVNSGLEQAANVAERIRAGIENYNFSDIAPGLNVTVSIGIANFKQYNSIQETLMSADNRMYRAKEMGRNQVVAD